MSFRIQDIKSELAFGGARPSLFQVQVNFPIALELPANPTPGGQADAERKLTFMCKAASIPASTIAPIEVPYWGRKMKVAGNRTFPEWSITIINDEDFSVRHAFEEWMQAINLHSDNLRGNGASSSPSTYKGDAIVRQFAKDEETPIRKYRFQGCWPSEVSAIELDWDTTDTIEEFTVTLQYDLWELDPNLSE